MTEIRQTKIDQMLSLRNHKLVVVLEDIHDPHNAAAVLRSCEAFGVSAVYYIFEKTKPYNPKKIGKESSSSANKWLNIHTSRSTTDTLTQLKTQGFTIISTLLDPTAISLLDFTLPFNSPIALLFGNEHAGLSQTAIQFTDTKLYLPMLGMVQSLNISVTAGICLFEFTRQFSIQSKS